MPRNSLSSSKTFIKVYWREIAVAIMFLALQSEISTAKNNAEEASNNAADAASYASDASDYASSASDYAQQAADNSESCLY